MAAAQKAGEHPGQLPLPTEPGSTRRVGVNGWLFDGFDAAVAAVTVIDGKHLWQRSAPAAGIAAADPAQRAACVAGRPVHRSPAPPAGPAS